MNCPRCEKEMEKVWAETYSTYICKCDPLCSKLLYTVMIDIRNWDQQLISTSIHLYFTRTKKVAIRVYPSRYELFLDDRLMVKERVEGTTPEDAWNILKRFSNLLAFT